MNYKIIKNFGNNPIEIYDGIEPTELFIIPGVCGLDSNYQSVDLVKEIKLKYQKDVVVQRYKHLYNELPQNVMALNKSMGKLELVSGYYAIMENRLTTKAVIILFTFFEVSPLRYNGYVHQILEEVR